MKKLDDYDFGFTIVTGEELPQSKVATDWERKAWEIHDAVQPFLDNLAGADGDYIHWPAQLRQTKIADFKDKLKKILQGQ